MNNLNLFKILTVRFYIQLYQYSYANMKGGNWCVSLIQVEGGH